MVYNTGMKEKLLNLLEAIEEDGCGLSWAPYRDACEAVRCLGPDMTEYEAEAHVRDIVSRWQREGCALPISL